MKRHRILNRFGCIGIVTTRGPELGTKFDEIGTSDVVAAKDNEKWIRYLQEGYQ